MPCSSSPGEGLKPTGNPIYRHSDTATAPRCTPATRTTHTHYLLFYNNEPINQPCPKMTFFAVAKLRVTRRRGRQRGRSPCSRSSLSPCSSHYQATIDAGGARPTEWGCVGLAVDGGARQSVTRMAAEAAERDPLSAERDPLAAERDPLSSVVSAE